MIFTRCASVTMHQNPARFRIYLGHTLVLSYLIVVLCFALLITPANGQLVPGLLSDFEDGTTQGWAPSRPNGVNVPGGPGDSTRFLEVSTGPPHLAVFREMNDGPIHPLVKAVSADLMRPDDELDIEMRLVLTGPGDFVRWTSTDFQVVPGNGQWDTYTFSTLEADLTQVLGDATYGELTDSLSRMLFRYDPGPPNSGGSGGEGTFGLDNVIVIPTCDFTGDGLCGLEDIDALTMEIMNMTNDPIFDLTGEGMVDTADRDRWLQDAGQLNLPSQNPYLLADFTLDGVVDGQDFLEWNANKFQETGKWSLGDANADGLTDGQDFIIWNQNKFMSSAGAAAVPEPASGGLALVILVAIGLVRTRR